MPIRLPLKHPFHLVSTECLATLYFYSYLTLVLGLVQYFHYSFSGALFTLFYGFFYLLIIISVWVVWNCSRSYLSRYAYYNVQRGLKIGMLLFILSLGNYVFFCFFLGFFSFKFSPTIEIGSIWPPLGFSLLILGVFH